MSMGTISRVNSVLGLVNTDSLGFTLSHEHLVIAWAGLPRDYFGLFSNNLVERLVQELKYVKDAGVDTIIDASTLDLGRDINLLAEVSRQTGINIIASTGWWLETPMLVEGISADKLARLFVHEINVGIAGTRIKAGILKAASDVTGVTSWQETVLRGIARAHLQTNVPIMLHSCAQRETGKKQLMILKEEGVNLKRVKMDHSNDTTDLHYLNWLLEQGCYLGMDRYPGLNELSMQTRTETLKALLDEGYVDRILPSQDWFFEHIMVDYPSISPFLAERKQKNPYGYLFLKKVVLPKLRNMGVPEEIVCRLCITGPRNFLEET